MSARSMRCPKCPGEMVQGFIWHSTGPQRRVSSWVEGAPEKSSWIFQESTKIPMDKCIPVGVFRCTACGFLESYAHPEFAAE